MKETIQQIPETKWKGLKNKKGQPRGCEYTEFIQSMDDTDKAFRVIMLRRHNPKYDLFGNEPGYCYHGIAANYLNEEKAGEQAAEWRNGRGNLENYNEGSKGWF